MARPLKDGVDYFPFDVVLDEKFDLIEAEFGLKGFAVIIKLYQRVYSRGYYCEWTDEVALLFNKQCGLSEGNNVVSEIVSAAIKRGIFDKNMFDKYRILTSKGIQNRYFEAVARRKCVNVNKQYLLIDVTKFVQNASINWIDVNINPKNDCNNSQTRLDETKGDKRRKDTKGAGAPCGVDSVFFDYAGTDDSLLSALKDFQSMRKQMKKPLTERAARMIVKELDELNKSSNPPVEVLEQSILHCWQGVFELKGDRSHVGNSPGNDKRGGNDQGISGKGWNVGHRI